MNIVEDIADGLDYAGDERDAEITGIRNIKRVPYAKSSYGYSYTFEAEINGEWIKYGPVICGNFSVRSDLPDHTLPDTGSLHRKTSTRTVWVGFYKLDRYCSELPLTEKET